MNPLSKLIIVPSVLGADRSWHYLSFWAQHGLNHWVIKYCPSGSRDLFKYDREPLVGQKSPRTLWGCSKSEFVRLQKWADHKPMLLPCYSVRVPQRWQDYLQERKCSSCTSKDHLSWLPQLGWAWIASHLWLKYQKVRELLLLGCWVSVCLNQACTKPLEGG